MPLTFETAKPADFQQIVDLCAQCLPAASQEFFTARLRDDPQLLRNGSLVAKEGNRVVSHVNVLGFHLMAGAATIPCAGIANVATHPDFRGRGASRTLLNEAHRIIRRDGYPIAALSTELHGFYAPQGYTVWERNETHLLQLRPPRAPSAPGVRKLNPREDLPALQEIHAGYCRRFIGCVDRPESVWRANFAWTPFFPHADPALALVVAADGRPQAYLRAAVDAAHATACIIEFGMRTHEHSEPMIAALADGFVSRALAQGIKAVRLPTPCRELITALSPQAAATTSSRNTTLMLNILDLSGFLRALHPELALRAGASQLAHGEVRIACGGQSTVLSVEEGRPKIGRPTSGGDSSRAVLEPAQWTEVLLGVKPFSTQPFALQSRLDETAINLLDSLFPRRDSVFWEADRF